MTARTEQAAHLPAVPEAPPGMSREAAFSLLTAARRAPTAHASMTPQDGPGRHNRQVITSGASPSKEAPPIMTATTEITHPAPLMYKVSDLVAVLRMSRAQVYRQIKAGRIRIVKEGDSTFVTAAALADYVALLEREAGDAR